MSSMTMTGLKRYPVYKASSIPWLGEIPDHWLVQRGKQLLKKMERDVSEDEDVITCFRDGQVTLRRNRRTEGFTESLKEIGYQGIRKGDLVIHEMDAFAGSVGVSDSDGKGTPVYSVCKPAPNANAYYYAAVVREMARSQWILALAKGIRERSTDFRYATLAAEPLPMPPFSEQQAIVRYLDDAEQRIRAYVSAKERLIALLEEERQAVIHQAVTKGLDPNVKLKPSGVEWLGDVPEHWSLRRLRSLASIKTGGQDTINRLDNGKYPFYVRSQTVERIDTWSYDGEAVLTAGDGGVGKIFHYAKGKFDYHQRVYKFSDFKGILGKFFFHYFENNLKNEVFQGTAKTTVDSLRLPMLQNFPVTVPPTIEQSSIVQYLEKVNIGIDAVIARAHRQIELIEEYRTRLVADVVTGEIDVREETEQSLTTAAQHPQEKLDTSAKNSTGTSQQNYHRSDTADLFCRDREQ